MSPVTPPRKPRSARLRFAVALLAWPVFAPVVAVAVAGASPPHLQPLASVPACEGRLRLETLPGAGALDGPRLRLLNPGGEAVAWRLASAARMEVLRGGEGVWLPASVRPEGVICR